MVNYMKNVMNRRKVKNVIIVVGIIGKSVDRINSINIIYKDEIWYIWIL